MANVSKPLSIFELGYKFQKMLEPSDGQPAKYNALTELAKGENVPMSTASNALRAVKDIPQSLIACIPSVSDMGRPSANSLRKIVLDARKSHTHDELILFAQEELTLERMVVDHAHTDITPTTLNQFFIKSLQSQLIKAGANRKPTRRAKTLYSNGASSAKIKGSDDDFTISFKDLGKKKAEIISAISQLLKS